MLYAPASYFWLLEGRSAISRARSGTYAAISAFSARNLIKVKTSVSVLS